MDMSRWAKESLIIRIIYFFTMPGLYDGSYFSNRAKALGTAIAGWYDGSWLKRVSLGKAWEASAVKDSRVTTLTFGVEPFARRFIDGINQIIIHSHLYSLVTALARAFVSTPFMAMAYTFLPLVFVSTGFRAVFSNFSKKDLALRIAMMAVLFFMSFIRASLGDAISTSFLGKFLEGLWGEEALERDTEVCAKAMLKDKKMAFAVLGSALGALHFYLPSITFIKLLGAVLFSTAVYLWPGWGMMAVAFVLPLAPTGYSVAIIGITFVSVLLNYRRFKLGVPCGMVPAAFFMIIAGISALFSFAMGDSLKSLPLYAAYFMIYYSTAVLYKDKKILKIGVAAQIVSTSLVAFYGIYQYFFMKISTSMSWVDVNQFPELRTRVYSTLENPNVLAEYLVLVIPLVLAALWVAKKLRQKVLGTGILGIMLLCLLLTFSRGAWIGMVLAIFAFAVIKAPGLAVFVVLLAAVSPSFLPPVVSNRIASIGSLEDSSNAYRISIWIAVARIIRDYWFTGIGLGLMAFTKIYRDYMIAGTYALHSHNLYLQIAVEMGIFGVIVFLWMAASGFSRAFTKVKGQHWSSYLLAGVTAALAGHLLHGLFEYIWYSPRVILAFWMTFGMISALSAHADNRGSLEEGAV